MTKKARILYSGRLTGYLEQTDRGYRFTYDQDYLTQPDARPVSVTLPLAPYPYHSNILFPFFDGLIPEGWLLNLAEKHYKLRGTDRFGLLLTLCRDTVGAVTVAPEEKEDQHA